MKSIYAYYEIYYTWPVYTVALTALARVSMVLNGLYVKVDRLVSY